MKSKSVPKSLSRMVAGLALALCGCGASSGALLSAAINTPIAVGASAARRASGRCYTQCDETTRCNVKTGLCDPLPCAGRCRLEETCVKRGLVEDCVAALPPEQNDRMPPAPESSSQPKTPASAPSRPAWLP